MTDAEEHLAVLRQAWDEVAYDRRCLDPGCRGRAGWGTGADECPACNRMGEAIPNPADLVAAVLKRLEAEASEWLWAARLALADQMGPKNPLAWKEGDPWPEADTHPLYEMVKGRGWCETPEPVVKTVVEHRDRAIVRVRQLEAALRPFADHAVDMDAEPNPLRNEVPVDHHYRSCPTVGDCRRAAEALRGAT